MISVLQKSFRTLSDFVNKVMEHLIGIALIILFVIIFSEVMGRSYLGFTLPWMPEAVGFLLAFITFGGMSCWVHRRKLLAIRFLKTKLVATERAALWFDIFTWVILGAYAFLLMTVGFEFAGRAIDHYTPSRMFSLYYARMILPFGGALIMMQSLNNLFQDILRLSGANVGKDDPQKTSPDSEAVVSDGSPVEG